MSPTIVAAAARKASAWLMRRSANVSKHVSLHFRSAGKHLTRPWIMSKEVHSVFRGANPRKLILRTTNSYDRSMVQAVRGSNRLGHVVLEREFEGPIGRNGEKILRVIINQTTGAIVTAFPAHEFLVPASGFGLLFIDFISDAVDEVDEIITQGFTLKAAAQAPRNILEFLAEILTDPSAAQGDEAIMLAIEAIHYRRVNELIEQVQQLEQRSLELNEQESIRQQYFDAMAGVAAPALES